MSRASRSSRIPCVSSGLGADAASSAARLGLGAFPLPISSSTGGTTACGVGSICLREDPGVSLLGREAKGLTFHSLHSSVSVKIIP